MASDAEELRQLILDKGIQWNTGSVHGKRAKWIFDLREVMLTSTGARLIASAFYEKLKDTKFDAIGGLSIAAEPLTVAFLLHALEKQRKVRGFIVRKTVNTFGLRKNVEGPINKGDSVVIIDDILNSGNSIGQAIASVESEGCTIAKILALVNFDAQGYQKFIDKGYDADFVFSLKDFGLFMNFLYSYPQAKKSDEFKIDGLIPMPKRALANPQLLNSNAYRIAIVNDGTIKCTDSHSEELLWSHQLGSDIGCAIIDDDLLLIGANSSLRRSRLYIFEISSGNVVKEISFKQAVGRIAALGKWYLISEKSNLHFVSKDLGMHITKSLPLPITQTAVERNFIFVSTEDEFLCLHELDLLWQRKIGPVRMPPVLFDQYVLLYSDMGVVFCMNVNSGSIKWLHEPKNRLTSMSLQRDFLLMGAEQGHIFLISAETGEVVFADKKWRKKLNNAMPQSIQNMERAGFNQIKEALKSMLLNEGIAWGSGLDAHNKPYAWALDTKTFLLGQEALKHTAFLFLEKLEKYDVKAVGGLTLASHLIASAVSFLGTSQRQYDAFLVRRERKKYNMMKLIEGPDISRKDVVIVDDSLNAAGFASQAIKSVEEIGCKIKAVVVLINFEGKEYRDLISRGYDVEGIFTLRELGLDAVEHAAHINLYSLAWAYSPINASDYGAPKSSPAAEMNRVFVGSDQGKLVCLDFSGRLLWEFFTEPKTHGVHQSPIIVEEKVIFSAYDGYVYCLDKSSGTPIWKNRISSYSGSSPIYDYDTNSIFVGTENGTLKGTLAALDAKSGHLKWEFMTRNHVPCRAAISSDAVVFGSNDSFIYCLDKWTGKLLWKYAAGRDVKGRITIDGDYCYATSFDGFLYCLDLKGSLLWKKKLGISLYNAPLVIDDLVIVGSFSRQVSALDKKNGMVKWHFMTKGKIISYPSYSEGRIFIGSSDGAIYVLDLKGNLLWKHQTKGPITSSPTLFEKKLFVNGNDGNLYCFECK